jgi:REP element-mobilizing transposase RayT
MPRGPRLDAAGVVQHVMTRGIERRRIFANARDYEDLLRRLDRVLPESGVSCLAWALMPNHVHLVLWRTHVSLSRVMARVNTGYAVGFNRRHRRSGHLFQNRFGSRLVRTTEDLLQLIRYVHMNPLAGRLVPSLPALETFPWCGHGALTGRVGRRAFHSVERALELFGPTEASARLRLRRWMRLGLGDASEEAPPMDETAAPVSLVRSRSSVTTRGRRDALDSVLERIGAEFGVTVTDLRSRSKRRTLVRARAAACELASRELGMTGRQIASVLGLAESTVSRAVAAGRDHLGEVRAPSAR